MSYFIEFVNDGRKRRRYISSETINKIPYIKDISEFVDGNTIVMNREGDYDTLFDILNGNINNISYLSNRQLNDIMVLSDYLLIDPRYMIYLDPDRFVAFFGLDAQPMASAINQHTNIDTEIRRSTASDLNIVREILKIDYINRQFYVAFAKYILNRTIPRDYYEYFLKETMKAIFIANVHFRHIDPIDRNMFNMLFDRRFRRQIAHQIN